MPTLPGVEPRRDDWIRYQCVGAPHHQDDAKQSPQAMRLIESLDFENPGYITKVSIVELYWVLTASYERHGAACQWGLSGVKRG
jgi:hypothetical protein